MDRKDLDLLINNNTAVKIKGYNKYYVTKDGDVISTDYKTKGNIDYLKVRTDKQGYKKVSLIKDHIDTKKFVHRLVAQAFKPNTNNLPQVNHKDENKANNNIDNLEWCTAEYNNNYGTKNYRAAKSNLNGKKSKRVAQIDKIGNIVRIYPSFMEAVRDGYNSRNMLMCATNNGRKIHKGYFWKYVSDLSCEEIKDLFVKGIVYNEPKRRVAQISKDGCIVKIWESTLSTTSEGFDQSNVSSCARGKVKSHKGYYWKYIE